MALNALYRLNDSQRRAAECSHIGNIAQVIAGPGTGKTHTLIARIIYLLRHYSPCEIVVVTFTRKAIQEIKDRLRQLIDYKVVNRMNIGTFHSICLGLLQKFNTGSNFIIWDDRDMTAAVKRAIEKVRQNDKKTDFKDAKSIISQWKNLGYDTVKDKSPMVQVFKAYEEIRIQSGAFDFDDLLINGRDLIKSNPSTISAMKCLLVDEFQDSNKVQVDIVESFCKQSSSVWMVGDPDQAIYGFRGSAPKTFQDICGRIENIHLYHLTDNYRSTPEILKTAHKVIISDASLTPRQPLKSSLSATNLSPSLTSEDKSIGLEIQQLVNQSCGILNYGDFAILSRTSYELTRLEYALVTLNIPCVSLSSKSQFWNRIEHSLIIDYIRVINNQRDELAISRTINTPSRLIGPAKVKSAQNLSGSLFEGLQLLCKQSSTPRSTKIAIQDYLDIITEGKRLLHERTPLTALFDFLFKRLNLEQYLTNLDNNKRESEDDNQEQINSKVAGAMAMRNILAHYENNHIFNEDEVLMVRDFLQTLSVDEDTAAATTTSTNSKNNSAAAKLTLSTMHGAKGLEWSIVYVVNLHKTQMPFFRATQEFEIQEERRLLYVALTRAKYMLHLSYNSSLGLSEFLQPVEHLSQGEKPTFDNKDWVKLADIMGRQRPLLDDLNTARCIFQPVNKPRFTKPTQEKENIPLKRAKLSCQPSFHGGFIRASQLARVIKDEN